MTAQRLIHYLQDPQHLYDITYQELNNLVTQYPYCQNLRFLLAQKSKLDQHKNYPRDLELAATYSIDRSRLHKQVEREEHQRTDNEPNIVFEDDYLELKELNKLEKQLEENSFSPPPENPIFLEHGFDTHSELDLSILDTPSPKEQIPAQAAKELLPLEDLEAAFEFDIAETSETKPIAPPPEKKASESSIIRKTTKELLPLEDLEEAFEFDTVETDDTKSITSTLKEARTENTVDEIVQAPPLPEENLVPIGALEDLFDLDENIPAEDKADSTAFEDFSTPDLEQTANESKAPSPTEFISIENLEEVFNFEEEASTSKRPVDESPSETPKTEKTIKSPKKLIAIEDLEDILDLKEEIPFEIVNDSSKVEDAAKDSAFIEPESLIDRILNEFLPETPKEEFLVDDTIMGLNDFIAPSKEAPLSDTEIGEKISDNSLHPEIDSSIPHEEVKHLLEEEEHLLEEDIEISAISDRSIPPKEQKQIPVVEDVHEAIEVDIANRVTLDLLFDGTKTESANSSDIEKPDIRQEEPELVEEIIEETIDIPTPKQEVKVEILAKKIVFLKEENEESEKEKLVKEKEKVVENTFFSPPKAVDTTSGTAKQKDKISPSLDKKSFNNWLKNFHIQKTNPPTIQQENPIEVPPKVEEQAKESFKKEASFKKKKKDKKKKKKKDAAFAQKSIKESEEIISQTLADLLAAQGYSEKAIKMYERLSLIFPEKSGFFAEKIKELSYFKD